MTIKEKIEQLSRAVVQLQTPETYIEMNNKLKLLKRDRIFGEGVDINGNKLTYSTKEIWVGINDSPRKLTPKGKSRDAKKTAYFAGGYGEFKRAAGRDNRPFFLYSHLQTAYLNSYSIVIQGGKAVLGASVSASSFNPAEKLEGLESKYSKFFSTSDKERAEMGEAFRAIVNKLIS